MWPREDGRWSAVILAVALLLRLTAALWWQQRVPAAQRFAMPDSHSYWYLAGTIARGEPYQFGGPDARVFRTPGYPLLLAPIVAAFGDGGSAILAARALGAVLGTLTVGLTMVWARSLWGARAALWAGALAAVYPGLIGLSVLILSEALFFPLMVAHLWSWTQADRAPTSGRRYGWSAAAGLSCGAAILTRPSWLLFLPVAVVLGLCWSSNRSRWRITGWAVMCVTCGLTMLPWWIRNYQVTGHFVPTTLQAGASLYDGLNPRATGASNMWFSEPAYQEIRADAAAGRLPAGHSLEYELDQRLMRDALHWARRHPQDVARLALRKLARLWNIIPNDPQFRSGTMRLAVAMTSLPLLILGGWGICRAWPYGWPAVLCFFPAIYLTLLHTVFVSSLRYREPAMLGLMVLAAVVLTPAARLRVPGSNSTHKDGAAPTAHN